MGGACEQTTGARSTRRRALALLACLGLLVVGAASCSGNGSTARSTASRRPAAHPPVVLLVFDEFSTVSLLDRHGRIDPVRYPSFASLARDGTWFPYATSSLDETGRAMRSLFVSRTTWRYAKPTYAGYPHNLFTALGRRYRIDASEEVSSFCPRRLCPNVRPHDARSILHELGGGRPERFERWLHTVRPSPRPTLYFKHVLLPHQPWRYLPSGRSFDERPIGRHFSWQQLHFNRWLVNHSYQRHLLQVGFTDRLLGLALARLRAEGLYERSLIVVTADNGEGFGRLGNGHELSRADAGDIALTPLLVKLPFDRGGRIGRRHVRTIDVLPTIARVAHIRIGWPTEGRSVLGPAARQIPSSTLLVTRSGHRLRLSLGRLRARGAASLRAKLRLFGSGRDSLYRIGPNSFMDGTPVSRWRPRPPGTVRAALDSSASLGRVRLASGFLPLEVTGSLRGRGSGRHLDLAIAVNGTVVATAPTVAVRRGQAFAALVPESAVRDGRNRIELFAIRRGPRLVALGS
jgi:hypothetical protein